MLTLLEIIVLSTQAYWLVYLGHFRRDATGMLEQHAELGAHPATADLSSAKSNDVFGGACD